MVVITVVKSIGDVSTEASVEIEDNLQAYESFEVALRAIVLALIQGLENA